ncbi:cytochrome d ubiquinol oxidase subunit II [Methylomonas methanica]|uniref:Cytochrome d ubiquinol oxidase, subunit II n=1 Tax=Methylomonas methanica (strain DSM 25384 / MC09) TaxID=857087 RepID=G0A260_METMM|nr:cytochrome d ubiquinol oxidase subunit II [Methylomonas methanica]AEG02603.1 cytochrome d ubiquinol oxidase, subunit II [Methylomonas methanica MC09]
MPVDLESLRLLGWALLGLIMVMLVLCEGLTLGVTLLLPVLGTDDRHGRNLINSIAPASMGNLAWLVVLVALLFAAWPIAYAVAMASLYTLLLPILLMLLLRPLALYFLDDCNLALWQRYGKNILAAGGLVPAALLGILVGNLLKGIPFHLDSDMRILFLGDFSGLFNLFSLLIAAVCLALLAMYGAVFLQLRAGEAMQSQAKAIVLRAGLAFLVLFAAAGLWITHLEGYHISSDILPNAASNPLAKFVKRGEGLWLDNYEHEPLLWCVPVLAFLAGFAVLGFSKWDKAYFAMIASALCVTMTVLTFSVSMFPFLLPSNISLNSSLTIWDSSASRITLQSLFWVMAVALPLMLICSRWVFCAVSCADQGNVSAEPAEQD